MALAMKLTKSEYEALAEGLRAFYVADGEEFKLDVSGAEDVSALKKALENERNSHKEYEKLYKAFKEVGKTPEEIKKLIEQANAAEEERLRAEGNYKELLELEKAKTELAKKQSAEKLTSVQDELNALLVNSEIYKGLAEFGGEAKLLVPVIKANVRVIEDAEGKHVVQVLGDDRKPKLNKAGELLSIHDYIAELKEQEGFSVAFKGSGKSGTGASGGSASGSTSNPFAKETFNLTEQAILYKTDPEKAQRLAREANYKL